MSAILPSKPIKWSQLPNHNADESHILEPIPLHERLKMPNLGTKRLMEVLTAMGKLGLDFMMPEHEYASRRFQLSIFMNDHTSLTTR